MVQQQLATHKAMYNYAALEKYLSLGIQSIYDTM